MRARLADADPEPGERELPEILREAASARVNALHTDERHGDDVAPVASCRQQRDRDAHDGIDAAEHDAGQKTELEVAQHQIELDPLEQDGEQVSVEVVERADQHEDGTNTYRRRLATTGTDVSPSGSSDDSDAATPRFTDPPKLAMVAAC